VSQALERPVTQDRQKRLMGLISNASTLLNESLVRGELQRGCVLTHSGPVDPTRKSFLFNWAFCVVTVARDDRVFQRFLLLVLHLQGFAFAVH
jgi:hypothetical protein